MGKVHGSLARAGKVKSQTPIDDLIDDGCFPPRASRLLAYSSLANRVDKTLTIYLSEVEKQEKAKVPKGRAKKRLQYTRRFVNVTLTGGKRKMNPNPGT
ncbi:ribosomal protein S30 [Nemania sp. NC0429]|nr:ribosomal protein S30 [Nemania sp. NC0429]